ncbi:hypothetical protein [Atlantibacter hermannii]|uniref:hypothetical protein n=1 Tax=Atlantibacter hermannii TaxID=565 RepID=UPI002930BBDE|nr:hypothetical protein [Atlantibacter hermannii]
MSLKTRCVRLSGGIQQKVVPQRSQENIFRPGLFKHTPVQRDESGLLVFHPVAPGGGMRREIGVSDIRHSYASHTW